MTTIYLTRHGETEENAAHILQGHIPGNLSNKGIQQLKNLRQELSSIHFDLIISSDLKRCADSAKILNEERNIPIIYTSLIRERDWGSFTGKYIPDIQNLPMPKDVESIEDMQKRAAEFINYIQSNYNNQTILVVSHGLFCRALRSVYLKMPMNQIDRMQNASYHILSL